jgi:16S rRNA (uracil1498-N3)-methyltransferase
MLVKLVDLAQDLVEGEVNEKRFVDRPKPSVGMLQGLAKGSKIDFVVQKLVEVGVDRVAIFEAGRSVPLWSETKKSKALERWRAIGREAAKQSRRPWLPEVLGPLNLEQAVEFVGTHELKLFADSEGQALSSVLSGASPQSVIGVIGPEGGFKDSEIEVFAESTKAVSIGENILRTETAALVLTAALMYHFDRI